MSAKIPFLYKYISIAATYSAIRKLYYTKNMEYKTKINDKFETFPILYTHYICFGLFHGCMGVCHAPFNLLSDIESMEMYFRNIKSLPKYEDKDINFLNVLLDYHYK